jgi:hypothetical protein
VIISFNFYQIVFVVVPVFFFFLVYFFFPIATCILIFLFIPVLQLQEDQSQDRSKLHTYKDKRCLLVNKAILCLDESAMIALKSEFAE